MKHVVAVAVFALVFASGATASTTSTWKRPSTVVAWFKAHGATFPDGSHSRILEGTCKGYGPRRGSYAAPTFRTFECTLVGGAYGDSQWYDVRVWTKWGNPQIVLVHDIY